MHEAEAVYGGVVESTEERASRLEEALFVGENFQQVMIDVMQSLRAVHDNLLSQDSPGADPATLQQQLHELQVFTRTQVNYIQPRRHIHAMDCVKTFCAAGILEDWSPPESLMQLHFCSQFLNTIIVFNEFFNPLSTCNNSTVECISLLLYKLLENVSMCHSGRQCALCSPSTNSEGNTCPCLFTVF